VLEQVLPHVPVVAVDAVRRHRVVLVQVERHHAGEVETLLAVHPDQLAVDTDRRAARREAEHRLPALGVAFPDDLRDPFRDLSRDLVVVLDDLMPPSRSSNLPRAPRHPVGSC
jgi:hypothetical protein